MIDAKNSLVTELALKSLSDTPDASAMTPAELVELFQSPDFQSKYRDTLNRCHAGERMTQQEFAAAIGLAWSDFILLHSALFMIAGMEPVIFDDSGAKALHLRQKKPVLN